jgi:hypothetical protein
MDPHAWVSPTCHTHRPGPHLHRLVRTRRFLQKLGHELINIKSKPEVLSITSRNFVTGSIICDVLLFSPLGAIASKASRPFSCEQFAYLSGRSCISWNDFSFLKMIARVLCRCFILCKASHGFRDSLKFSRDSLAITSIQTTIRDRRPPT